MEFDKKPNVIKFEGSKLQVMQQLTDQLAVKMGKSKFNWKNDDLKKWVNKSKCISEIPQKNSAKEYYKLFISHARKDRRFSDFIYNLLITKGAKAEEIFYTTRQVQGNSTLSQDIKDNIMENNTMVLFLDSANFMRSSYCLFEGGAFWATRSMDSCIHIHFDTAWIPDYINDHEKYHVPLHNTADLQPLCVSFQKAHHHQSAVLFRLL